MIATADLSPAGQIARTHDPDRFLCALFAPADRREALFMLIALNHELVRAVEIGSGRGDTGPLASLIRLQWWREVIEGEVRRHEVAEPLAQALSEGRLDRETLLGIVEAREAEVDGVETLEAWRSVQLGGPGGMQVATGLALGVLDPVMLQRLRVIGAAYAAGAMLRWLPRLVNADRSALPPGEGPGDRPGDRIDAREGGDFGAATLAAEGKRWLAETGRPRLERSCMACAMPLVLARRDLARPPNPEPRGLGDRVALTAAWLRGAP